MRPRPSVVNITQDMQMVYHQSLNQLCQGNDKFFCSPDGNNGVDNLLIIGFLIRNIRPLGNQFFYHISEIFRQSFAHLRSGVFRRCFLTHFNKAVQGDFIPLLPIMFLLFNEIHLFSGVINQRGKTFLVLPAHGVAEYRVNFSPHRAGTIL